MVYINYVTTKSMSNYTTPDELAIYKKVLNGDSFEITSFYLSPRSRRIDRDSDCEEYHQNAVFTIKTDAGETEEFNIDVGHILYNPGYSSYYRQRPDISRPEDEIYTYLIKFGIACKNKTVLFTSYKEKYEIVNPNTQLINWLKEKTIYIDSMFEKVSKVQKKKRELEADFKGNLSDEVFEESEIEDYHWHEYKK